MMNKVGKQIAFWSNIIELSLVEDKGNDENYEYTHPMHAVSVLNKESCKAVVVQDKMQVLFPWSQGW